MPSWYPVMWNVADKLCVVAGGGTVAERKIAGLREAGARIAIVSPSLTPGLAELVQGGGAQWRRKEAEPSDLAGAALAFAATDDPAANRRWAAAAREAGVPVNVADDGESGDFLVPAVLRRGDFVLAAGVSGAGPALAARVARELAERYGPEYESYAAALREMRGAVKAHVEDPAERRRLLKAAAEEDVLRDGLADGIAAKEPQELLAWLRARISGK